MSYEYLRKVSRSCKKFSKQSLISAGMLELFLNQNCPEIHQLTLMVVTHTIHARGGGGGKKRRKKEKKLEGLKKSEFRRKKVGKTASLFQFGSQVKGSTVRSRIIYCHDVVE